MNQINDHHARIDTVAEADARLQRVVRCFAFGCTGNCNQGRVCDCACDCEVCMSQMPGAVDPTEAPAEKSIKRLAVCVIAAVALVALIGWFGWPAWQ